MNRRLLLGNNEEYVGFFFEGIEEWSQFFTPCNWRDFHPVHLYVEDDRIMGGVEATLIVLGVGFRVRWNYARTEQVEEIKARMGEVMNDLKLSDD